MNIEMHMACVTMTTRDTGSCMMKFMPCCSGADVSKGIIAEIAHIA